MSFSHLIIFNWYFIFYFVILYTFKVYNNEYKFTSLDNKTWKKLTTSQCVNQPFNLSNLNKKIKNV